MATRRREATTHKIKSWPESFRATVSGRKRFEIRKDDRNYQAGDIVELLEFEPTEVGFTGRSARFFVGYVERSGALPNGWVGFELITGDEINRISQALGVQL